MLYSVVGIGLGLMMVSIDDHSQMPTHAHIMLVGFIVMFMFGVFYRLWPEAEKGYLPVIHFALSHLTFIGLVAGFWLTIEGQTDLGEMVRAPSTTIFLANQFLFAWIVFKATR